MKAELRAALEETSPNALSQSSTQKHPLEPLQPLPRGSEHFAVSLIACFSSTPSQFERSGTFTRYAGHRCSLLRLAEKCLSCPPGIAPLSFGERAVEKLGKRKTKVRSWYLDLSMLGKYWGKERTYHHTAPISMNYALREALCLVAEEGLEARWKRHRENAELLWSGLAEIGLGCHVNAAHRILSLTTVSVSGWSGFESRV